MQFCLCLFSPLSIHPWVSSCLRPLRLLHTSVLRSVDTASSLNLLWSFCLSVFSLSSLSLSLPVLVRACWYQSHWQALWTQLTFLSHSLARPLSLSLFFSGSCYSSNRASSSPPRKWVKQPQCKTSAVQQTSAACTASNSGSQELNMLTLEALSWAASPVCHWGCDDWHVNRPWIAPVSAQDSWWLWKRTSARSKSKATRDFPV